MKWLMSLRDLSGRLARWSLQLQAYDFEIEHCKGADNIVVDTHSRFVDSVEMEENEEQKLQIEEEDFKSAEYLNRIQVVAENQEELPDLKIEEGKIFKRSFDKNQIMGARKCYARVQGGTLFRYFVSRRHCKKLCMR